tara:strand:- start:286 stop:591 length:306 start_codon:yes stop_codon:yes gene_type:complete
MGSMNNAQQATFNNIAAFCPEAKYEGLGSGYVYVQWNNNETDLLRSTTYYGKIGKRGRLVITGVLNLLSRSAHDEKINAQYALTCELKMHRLAKVKLYRTI